MDIESYILGKKASGGGSSDLDWSAIGYTQTPQSIIDGYNYAIYIQNNWDRTKNFRDDKNIVYMPLLDDINVTTFSEYFYGCTNLKEMPALEVNSKNLSYMFYDCPSLQYVDTSNFDTGETTSMRSMFANCYTIKNIDVSSFNTKKVIDMNQMFTGCKKLTELDLSNFETTALTNIGSMFSGCTSLTKLDVRKFEFNNITTYNYLFGSSSNSNVPDDCLIIVKDDTQKTWIETNFSRLTNVQTASEYEASLTN